MILYGASGHAKVIIDTLIRNNEKVSFLLDDNEKIKDLLGYKVYKPEYDKNYNANLIISIGNNTTRREIVNKYNFTYGRALSNFSSISNYSAIGDGSVVFAGCIIQASSKIQNHCIINTKASIDHDCYIHKFVHIGPGSILCGGVEVGEGSFIGAGSVILPNIRIGKWTVIGAGSVVTKDIPDSQIWFGNPAKFIKQI